MNELSPRRAHPVLAVAFGSLLFFVCLMSSRAAFVPLENFNALTAGNVNGQNGWVSSDAFVSVAADPANATNKVLSVSNFTANVYKPLGVLAITNNTTGTLFYRFRRANTQVNISHGLSDTAAPTSGNYSDFEPQLNSNGTNPPTLNARDAATFKGVGQFQPDTWYSTWLVVNNTRDLYNVYLQGGLYTNQTLLTNASEFAFTFRNTTGDSVNNNSTQVASNLITFVIKSSSNSNNIGPFFVDDIYVDVAGTNLINPVADTNAPVIAGFSPAPGSALQFLSAITITFDEPVLGVAASNLLINATPATNVTGSGATWTFAFAQPTDGQITVALAANQNITDGSGNRFGGTNAWSYTLLPPDFTPPALSAISPEPGWTVTNWLGTQIMVRFSEPVTGVNASDLLVNGTPASSVSNLGNSYYFTAPQPLPGPVTNYFVAGHGIVDFSSNPMDETAPAHRWGYTFTDMVAPLIAAIAPASGTTVRQLTAVEVTFNEVVTGVDAADLLVNGVAARAVTGSGAGPYHFTFDQPPFGNVVFAWASGHGINDVSLNAFAGGAWTNKLTFGNPGLVLFDKFESLTNGPVGGQNGWVTTNEAFVVTADPEDANNKVLAANTMLEAPLCKALGSLTIANDAVGTVFFRMRRANTALNVSYGLTDLSAPTAFGDYESQLNINTTNANNLSVRDAGAFDAVDTFTNDVWYSVWMVTDNARDLVTVYMQGGTLATQTLLDGNTDGETSFTFRNTVGDLLNTNTAPVVNALRTFFFRTGTNHIGPVYLDDIYIDALGVNLANPVAGNTVPPRIVTVDPDVGTTLGAFSAITVNFNEPVLNVSAGDLLVNGTPAMSVAGAGTMWTFSFPQPAAGLVTLSFAATQNITDDAANRFDHTNVVWTYQHDMSPPAIVAIWPPAGATLSNWGQIAVTFDEPVFGVDFAALVVNGVPATAVTNAGNTCFFTVSAPAPGLVSIGFDPGRPIRDAVGNALNAGLPWSYTFVDDAPPLVSSVTPAAGATVTRIEGMLVQFNELVTGVNAGDLLINGIEATNVTGSGAGPYQFAFVPPGPGTVQFTWAAGHGIVDVYGNAFGGGAWSNMLVTTGALGRVIINEFLANNVRGLSNEFGVTEDWIELYNSGTNAVSLLGWSLSDDAKQPGLWTLPDVMLNPGGYLVVFADGRDLASYSGTNQLHTNFKLNDQGDYLGLFNADFPKASVSELPAFPEQRGDYSYGLNSSSQWRYYSAPTPGGPNGESSIAGVTPMPHVNAGRGLYSQPFTLIASCSLPEAALRYTTDGSQPTEVNGTLYGAPLTISNTVIFRIAAFATNRLPSRVSTHSYIFSDSVLVQPNNPSGYPAGTNVWTGYPSDYEMDPEVVGPNPAWVKASLSALPTLSIAISIDDMFGSANGLYTHPEPPVNQRYLWERACSAELILTNGQTAFQMDCGIRVQGNASRTPQKTPKHPFRLLFKGAYGPGTLDYPIFPDTSVQSFNTMVLRSDFNAHWLHWSNEQRPLGSKVRDAWSKRAFAAMTGINSHSRPVHLYLNGIYWGVYDLAERIDAEWAAANFGGAAEEWDAIASKPTEAIDGNLVAYNAMVNLGRNSDMRVGGNYSAIQQQLDMPIFIDYMLLNFYGANLDWGLDGNWNAVRRRAAGQKFKYAVWDGELNIVATNGNRVSADIGGYGLAASQGLPSGLHPNLTNSPQYRMDFADRVHKHCFNDGILTGGAAADLWLQRAREVEQGMLAESARWGDYRRDVHQYSVGPYDLYTTNAYWWPEIERMRTNYFPVRTGILLDQLRAVGLYPNVAAPVFNQHGGRVLPGFNLLMTAAQPIYFTTNGVDPRIAFSGEIAPGAMLYSGAVSIPASMVVKARALNDATWSALNEAVFEVAALGPQLHITEIMFNPVGGSAYEFLELRNDSLQSLDVSRWYFGGVTYTFSGGTVLAAGQTIVLANNTSASAFAARYPGVVVFGYFGGSLDNGGERISVHKPTGEIVVSVDYHDNAGWPRAADGSGYSLEIIDPANDPDAASNWRATSLNGTPGGTSPNPAPALVWLNEVLADNVSATSNAGTFPDWVELYNAAPTNLNLAGWSLTDDSDPRKFVFSANTIIPAGGYLLIYCDTNVAAPGLHAGFSLSSAGETISLFNDTTSRVDVLTFGLQLPDYSIGRVGGQWVLAVPTPGSNNIAAVVVSQTNLLINEWLANSAPGTPDWLELFNTAAEPLSLQGIYVSLGESLQQVRSLSFLAGLGHVQLYADEQEGVRHLHFKLPAAGATIVLSDRLANEIDRVTYDSQAEAVAQGRLPDGSATIASFPNSASPGSSNYIVSFAGPLLNEVMAINRSTVTNLNGATADWVEFYNPFATNFPLVGFRLSTSAANPSQWVFPAGVSVPASGYLVVWFDNTRPASAVNEAQLNTGRSLDGDSDQVYLFDTTGQVVDAVEFGPQAADWSIGRSGSTWFLMSSPTPGASNAAPAALASRGNLRINEWLAASAGGVDEFFELFNPSAQPVDLSGLYLTDDLSAAAQAKFQVAPLSFIAPLDFVEFKADGDPSKGRNHVNFKLDADGEALRLSDRNLAVIDTVFFGSQVPGVSQGSLPDGSLAFATFVCPTPGLGNQWSSLIAITAQPQAQAASLGDTVTLTVKALSGSPLFYQWFFYNTALAAATNATFALTNAQAADSGLYHVLVSNACASAASGDAIVTIGGGTVAGVTVSWQGGQPLLSFVGQSGRSYTIQRTLTLSPPAWTNIALSVANGSGVVTFLETGTPPTNAFYRVRWP